jgi:hypothetical protein
MMLASTVQFSKCGRSRIVPARRVRSGPSRGAAAEATVPSGPNSVLDPGDLLVGVPSRKRAY